MAAQPHFAFVNEILHPARVMAICGPYRPRPRSLQGTRRRPRGQGIEVRPDPLPPSSRRTSATTTWQPSSPFECRALPGRCRGSVLRPGALPSAPKPPALLAAMLTRVLGWAHTGTLGRLVFTPGTCRDDDKRPASDIKSVGLQSVADEFQQIVVDDLTVCPGAH